MARNKKRIYMSLYARTGSQEHIHHFALLVSPKNPTGNNLSTWRLHAMNRPNPAYATQQEWQYKPAIVPGRTTRLLALVLLGKTQRSGEDISNILTAVELVQDDPSWTCKEWVFGAIEVRSVQIPCTDACTLVQ
ncbi:hypothetical protein M404DRAFT_853188 [Pisolithus tinctorius Marx 270]|uniref:Uncharacterized protein n=1 Tax=Pisolithus tinctorius Marx 270 TaxID=870435 RepID=A0A0C3NRV9_PISTI|nr:hypothetical protein M404DRAFT_853188 [Pisolithus tinctorius Marx 270]